MKESFPTVACIGSLSQDIFFPLEKMEVLHTEDDLLSQEKIAFEFGAKIRAQDRFEAPGGCATNVSQGLARLGVSAALFSCVGEDMLGKHILALLTQEGVETSFVNTFPGKRTDISFILVEKKSGERTIFYNRDANEHLFLEEHELSSFPVLFVTGFYGNAKEKNAQTILRVAQQTKASIAYNPSQSNIARDPELVKSVVQQASLLFVNKDEAREILLRSFRIPPPESEEEMLHLLLQQGPERVVLTDGPRGAWALHQGEQTGVFLPSHALKDAKDMTGAGDAFTAGFLAAYLQKKTLQEALLWGRENARSVVRFYGARDGLLRRKEMEDLLSS